MKQERLLKVILAPHMSEKVAVAMQERRQYAFAVVKSATKLDVKNAVEELFKTKVDAVRIVNVKSKPKRFGQIEGRSKAWKKAYVTLAEGQAINLTGEQ